MARVISPSIVRKNWQYTREATDNLLRAQAEVQIEYLPNISTALPPHQLLVINEL